MVEAETAPEARHVVRCARVEEAGARERRGLQRRAVGQPVERVPFPLTMIKGLDSSLDRDVLLVRVFGRRADVVVDWSAEKNKVLQHSGVRLDF